MILLAFQHLVWLQALLELLAKVVEHEDQTLMGLGNVALVMAPNLFMPQSSVILPRKTCDLHTVPGCVGLMHLLLKHQEMLWMVSNWLSVEKHSICFHPLGTLISHFPIQHLWHPTGTLVHPASTTRAQWHDEQEATVKRAWHAYVPQACSPGQGKERR